MVRTYPTEACKACHGISGNSLFCLFMRYSNLSYCSSFIDYGEKRDLHFN